MFIYSENDFFSIKSSLPLSCHQDQKHITFSLPPAYAAGGFGDRLGGMVTTFYHAIITESSYSVDYNKPYHLSNYFLLPNCSKHLSRHYQYLTRGLIDVVPYYGKGVFVKDIGKNLLIRTNSHNWALVARNEQFKSITSKIGINQYSSSQLFQAAIDSIFILPQDNLKNSFESKLNSMNNQSYIGVQLRIGGKHVDWTDPPRHSLNSIECFVLEVIRLMLITKLSTIFITGDSQSAIERFKLLLPKFWMKERNSHLNIPIIYENDGKIAHTDRSENVVEQNSNEIWLKSILDWWMLRHSSALVISRSGFGETAAWSSNTLYKSKNNGIPLSRSFYYKENTIESNETETEILKMKENNKYSKIDNTGKNCIFYNTFYSRNDQIYFGTDQYKVSKWFI